MDVKVKGRAGLLSPDPWPIQSLARALLSSTCPPPPCYRPGGFCSEDGYLPGSPGGENAGPATQTPRFVYSDGSPGQAEQAGGRNEGQRRRNGGHRRGGEKGCGMRGGRELGAAGEGTRGREAAAGGEALPPHPAPTAQTAGRVHSPPPPPSRELLAARERKGW